MRHIDFNNRHSEREARLCHMSFDAPQSGPATHEHNPQPTWAQHAMDFLNKVPLIKDVIPAEDTKNEEIMKRITSDQEWISMFLNNSDIINTPYKPNLPPNTVYGPEDVFAVLDNDARKEVYMQYINLLVPYRVQRLIADDEIDAMTDSQRFEFMKMHGKLPLLHAVMAGTFGMEAWDKDLDDDQKKLVTEGTVASIKDYYKIKKDLNPIVATKSLEDDFTKARSYLDMADIDNISTTPELLQNELAPSHFKGALMFDVVKKEDLQSILPFIKEREHDLRQTKFRTSGHLDNLMGETAETYKKEAETLADTFNNLGGIEKLVLIGALVYGLFKSKFVRGAAGLLTAGYFFQKFVLKNENPIDQWSSVLGRTKETIIGDDHEGAVTNVRNRSETIVNFLDDYSIDQLERQAIGFGILNDMPMNLLAKNFHMVGDRGEGMVLNVQDPAFNQKATSVLKEQNLSTDRYQEFFANETNIQQVSNAVSYVFFLESSKEPSNRPEAQHIFEVLRKLPAGTSLSIFGDVRNIKDIPTYLQEDFKNAHDSYVSLVGKGREMAQSNSQTLGEFMSSGIGFNFVPRYVQEEGSGPNNAPSGGGPNNLPNNQNGPNNAPSGGGPNNLPNNQNGPNNAPSGGGPNNSNTLPNGPNNNMPLGPNNPNIV